MDRGTYFFDPYSHPHMTRLAGKPTFAGHSRLGAATPEKKKEVTLSEAVSLGYLGLARLAVLSNIYLVASAGQAVANKVFAFDRLLEHPLDAPETQAAITMYKWATLTGPRLLSEALASNDVHRFQQVQNTTKKFADMVLKEVPASLRDNALYDFVYNVFVKTTVNLAQPKSWPWWAKVGVGLLVVSSITGIYADVK